MVGWWLVRWLYYPLYIRDYHNPWTGNPYEIEVHSPNMGTSSRSDDGWCRRQIVFHPKAVGKGSCYQRSERLRLFLHRRCSKHERSTAWVCLVSRGSFPPMIVLNIGPMYANWISSSGVYHIRLSQTRMVGTTDIWVSWLPNSSWSYHAFFDAWNIISFIVCIGIIMGLLWVMRVLLSLSTATPYPLIHNFWLVNLKCVLAKS